MEVLLGLVCCIIIVIGCYYFIKGLSYMYYASYYLKHIDELINQFMKWDLENKKLVEYEENKVKDAIKQAKTKGIIYFVMGIILIILFTIPLLY